MVDGFFFFGFCVEKCDRIKAGIHDAIGKFIRTADLCIVTCYSLNVSTILQKSNDAYDSSFFVFFFFFLFHLLNISMWRSYLSIWFRITHFYWLNLELKIIQMAFHQSWMSDIEMCTVQRFNWVKNSLSKFVH